MVEPGGRSASKPPRDGAVCRAVNAIMLMCGCAKVARAWRREGCRAARLLVCCAGGATLTFRLAHKWSAPRGGFRVGEKFVLRIKIPAGGGPGVKVPKGSGR